LIAENTVLFLEKKFKKIFSNSKKNPERFSDILKKFYQNFRRL